MWLLPTGANIVDAGVAINVERIRVRRPHWGFLAGELNCIGGGWTGGTCGTLKQFARTAIPRIGT
jgi:hypothetical protein